MMKKCILVIACCIMLISISTIAYGDAGPYVNGNLGIAIPNDSDVTDSTVPGVTLTFESDSGPSLGAALGYDAEFIRYEGEIVYSKSDLNKASVSGLDGSVPLSGDTSTFALLLNFYIDIENKSTLVPFITAGLGYANVEISPITVPGFGPVTTSSEDDNVFAYQFGVGVSHSPNEKVTLDLKYRYFETKDLEFSTTKVEYSSHNISAGIRYAF